MKRSEEINNTNYITREYIEQLSDIEPYCFDTDREEWWFNIGLKYGLEAADDNPISPWISVNDDLPYKHKELISLEDKRDTKQVIAFANGTIVLSRMRMMSGNWYWENVNPTYWMPIPELPKNR